MQLLPLEVLLLIVALSSGSPSSLAALARTHPTCQREAERALYDSLSIHDDYDSSLKCLETLATNSEKTALVRFLIIEYDGYENFDYNQGLTTHLSNSLINMRSLSDFRIRCCPGDEAMMKDLGKILWLVYKILIF